MLNKKNFIILILLILTLLFLTSCFLNPPVTEGILKGQVLVPEGTLKTKDLTGQALPYATVNIIDLTTDAIIATVTTDATGHYQVSVPPGGPYLLEAVKESIKLEQITCAVEVGIEYELGNVDCVTTAAALIAQAMMDNGINVDDIDCAAITTDTNFENVSTIVCNTIKSGGDTTASSAVNQAIEEFLHPPEPESPPAPTSVSLDRYVSTAGNNSGDGSAAHPWLTIQYALDNTPDGGTIHVNDGTYEENIVFPLDKVSIVISENGATFTTIDGSKTATVVSIHACPEGTILDGFTIRGGNGSKGGGLFIYECSPTIQNNTILGNTASLFGSGICIRSYSSPTIKNNLILSNSGSVISEGGGIYISDSSPTIEDNIISGNTAKNAGGICISGDCSPKLINNTIWGNISSEKAGGIFIDDNSSPNIQNNTISENSCVNGGGIYMRNSSPTLKNNTISENSATANAGGVYIHDCVPTFENNIISENIAATAGGVYIDKSSLTIQSNTIRGNFASDNGGGVLTIASTANIKDNHISNNTAKYGGGIHVVSGTPIIQSNTISGNTANGSPGTAGGILVDMGPNPIIGGTDGYDTTNFNIICGNSPIQILPDYPNNYISDNCMSITSFGFELVNNVGLSGDITGLIDYDNRTVSIEMHIGTDLSALMPTIAVSSGCTLSPESGVAQDFSIPMNYTVTSPDGEDSLDWVVTVKEIYIVGDTGPAGGLIFYDKGIVSEGWRYLEAAPNDQTSRAWGTYNHTVPGADGIEIGTGQQNTLDTILGDTFANKAADECANYSIVNGGVTYNDWFLPSKDELSQMYENLKSEGVGGFADYFYWSSSEVSVDSAWCRDFDIGSQSGGAKNNTGCVRAVRAF